MAYDEDTLKKLEALQDRFKNRLTATIEEIESWGESSCKEELIAICHKLAGTAGTYGYLSLGQTMKEIEGELLKTTSDHDVVAQYEAVINALKTAQKD